jgi:excisionase family DNA binding protein
MSDAPVFLKRPEVATRLRISPRTVRRWGASGRLDERHLGPRTVRITEESVERLERAGRTRAAAA